MNEYLRRIESRAEELLQLDQSRHEDRIAIIEAAREEISRLFSDIEADDRSPGLREMLFERALRLFEEGFPAGSDFSPLLKKPTMLAALLGAVEYTGEVRDVPLIGDPDALNAALRLCEGNWHSRLVPKIVHMVLRHFLTLQRAEYGASFTLLRNILSRIRENQDLSSDEGRIIARLGMALIDSVILWRYLNGTSVSKPIEHLESIGFRNKHLYGQFTQAFALAWISSNKSDSRLEVPTVERLAGYSGDAEYRTVIWAHVAYTYANRPGEWDAVFPEIIGRLPDLGSTALWTIQQTYLSSYQVVLDGARALLQRWLNREMSRAFFDHLRFHPERKQFWERYVEKARSVRIAGSKEIVAKMLSRTVNPKLLRDRYVPVIGDIPALVIEGRTRIFIEYGEENHATYAYQKETGEQVINRVRNRSINNIKNPSLERTIKLEIYQSNPDVRLWHPPGWQNAYRRIFELTGEFQ